MKNSFDRHCLEFQCLQAKCITLKKPLCPFSQTDFSSGLSLPPLFCLSSIKRRCQSTFTQQIYRKPIYRKPISTQTGVIKRYASKPVTHVFFIFHAYLSVSKDNCAYLTQTGELLNSVSEMRKNAFYVKHQNKSYVISTDYYACYHILTR